MYMKLEKRNLRELGRVTGEGRGREGGREGGIGEWM